MLTKEEGSEQRCCCGHYYGVLLVFASGVASALLLYALLPAFRQAARAVVSPYGLLLPPDSSIQQLGLDELAFGRPAFSSKGKDVSRYVATRQKKEPGDNTSTDAEAVASLHIALEMKSSGKMEKALKLFQHALALQPYHPDILNHYGEFLEEQQNDIVQAEHMYTRAVAFSPGHTRALENRQRTFPQVKELDQHRLARIDSKRDQLAKVPEHSLSLRRVKKEAYFQYIYHGVAIEGNTMSLSQTRHIVETKLAVAGKSILEHNEVLGMDAALRFVNSTLVHRIGAITVQDILDMHKLILGYADPTEAGVFRRTQVFVGAHVPPRPSEVSLLMQDFVQWMNTKEALEMHPVDYAALAHHKLAFIHPFVDGNGRMARLLMNLILMQAGFPPVIIRKQDRQEYYEYLKLADEGDARPLKRFIAQCTEQTLDVYLYTTKEYPDGDIPELEGRDKGRTIIIEE